MIHLLAFAVIAGQSASSAPQVMPSPSEARKQIQGQYDRWSKAYMANDVDTLLAILSPDYTLTNVEKDTITLKTYKAYLNLRRTGPKDTTKYKTKIKKLVLHDDRADVNSLEDMTTEKPDPKTGVVMVSIHTHEYLDVWTLKDKSWLLLSTKTLKESTVTKPKK